MLYMTSIKMLTVLLECFAPMTTVSLTVLHVLPDNNNQNFFSYSKAFSVSDCMGETSESQVPLQSNSGVTLYIHIMQCTRDHLHQE